MRQFPTMKRQQFYAGTACFLWWLAALAGGSGLAADTPSFTRDIRPLLAAKCFACHGPDEDAREADLRLDQRQAALDAKVIVPGKPEESELVSRINSDDPDLRMPPPTAHDQLSDAQRQLFRDWIAAGAEYEPHWAFVPAVRPAVPDIGVLMPADSQLGDWPRNEIDAFVLRDILAAGLEPAAQADRYTLIRRVYLDLIGIPPTPQQADSFAADPDPRAYEHLVEELLRSPKYGERWARPWLDLARYSDTNGYEKDRPRSIWPYRDWVTRALNADMPYDQFSIEQLAGDMLPDATDEQRIATGFHRNTMLNEEGGIDPLEYRFYAMTDRAATTGTVWLGLTIGCAQCHTHKYDPITHTEYYQLMALLNNAEEPDLQLADAAIDQRREVIQERIDRLEHSLPLEFAPAEGDGPEADRRLQNFENHFQQWLAAARESSVDWQVIKPQAMQTNLPRLETLDDGSILSTGDVTKRDLFALTFELPETSAPITALRLEALPDDRLPAGGPGRAFYEGRKGDFFLSEVTAKHNDAPLKFSAASHSYGKISIGSGSADGSNVFDGNGSTGWSTSGQEGEASSLVLNFEAPLENKESLVLDMLFERHFAASLGRFRWSFTTKSGEVKASGLPLHLQALLLQPAELSDDQLAKLRHWYAIVAPELAEARELIDRFRKLLPEHATTMVMQERPADHPRPTHRYHRGEYLNPREEVSGAVPAIFPPLPADAPANRLTFAKWLVSERNPLAARVAVNRAWQSLFGAGLMRTGGDFGTQADPPTHPELLDWLACEFVANGWSQKRLHRLIVTSATYRQSSTVSEKLLARDPENRLWARGPRHRLEAEIIRDSLLQASGLLSDRMYGPSVYPPQPASVTALAYGEAPWKASTGEDRYRRSLYTFSKRTAPFAAFVVFDAPSGENCIAVRERSNTPLQALTLLNDEAYLEMARALAKEVIANESEERDDAEIAAAFLRRLLTRPPREEELQAMLEFVAGQRARLTAGELDPAKVAADPKASPETAAWIMLVRVLMNLDETVTKQ